MSKTINISPGILFGQNVHGIAIRLIEDDMVIENMSIYLTSDRIKPWLSENLSRDQIFELIKFLEEGL